jgi:hypothetical protein
MCIMPAVVVEHLHLPKVQVAPEVVVMVVVQITELLIRAVVEAEQTPRVVQVLLYYDTQQLMYQVLQLQAHLIHHQRVLKLNLRKGPILLLCLNRGLVQ